MPHDLALALYRISQEALTNVARHAQATRVSLIIERRADAAYAGGGKHFTDGIDVNGILPHGGS